MNKKTIYALVAGFIFVLLIFMVAGLYILPTVFGIRLFGSDLKTVSQRKAKHQIATYLNEKYNTETFSSRHISLKKTMVGCGCDMDPAEFVGYTAQIEFVPDAPVSPETVWMMFSERTSPFCTDDGQLDKVSQGIEQHLEDNSISPDYLLLPSSYGAGFDYGEFASSDWTPGKGFHTYFDGEDLSSFFDQEYKARNDFSGKEQNTYRYSIYFSIPGSETKISQEEFYQEMEELKNRFHLSLDAVLMKECFFRELRTYENPQENFGSYPSANMLSPAVYFSLYENSECYSPTILPLMPGISLTLNQKTETELSKDNFHLERIETPKVVNAALPEGNDGKIPDAALADTSQTYIITCKKGENSFEDITLIIDLDTLKLNYMEVGILESENRSSGVSGEYYSDSFVFTNQSHTKFQLGNTLVLSTVIFPENGGDSHPLTLTICPAGNLNSQPSCFY